MQCIQKGAFDGIACKHLLLLTSAAKELWKTLHQFFFFDFFIFLPRHTIVVGYYDFMLDVCVSVSPSVVCTSFRFFLFLDDNE